MKILKLLLLVTLLTTVGCSTLQDAAIGAATSAVGLDDSQGIDADVGLDVGANVQMGKTNNNTKVSNKATDKRLISTALETTNVADNITQIQNTPWWHYFLAVLAGILVDVCGLYERIREINSKYS